MRFDDDTDEALKTWQKPGLLFIIVGVIFVIPGISSSTRDDSKWTGSSIVLATALMILGGTLFMLGAMLCLYMYQTEKGTMWRRHCVCVSTSCHRRHGGRKKKDSNTDIPRTLNLQPKHRLSLVPFSPHCGSTLSLRPEDMSNSFNSAHLSCYSPEMSKRKIRNKTDDFNSNGSIEATDDEYYENLFLGSHSKASLYN